MKYIIKNEQQGIDLSGYTHLSPLLKKIISCQNYNEQEIQQVLTPKLIYHDFSLFEDAYIVLDRIQEAIENEEKICIYGDYDCDGILATTILVQAFKELGVDVGYHIPNRFSDGYGLNSSRVEQIAEKGYSLIITVDNGIGAFEAVDHANDLGVDVIITDHHQFGDDVPDALGIIHTKLSDAYPFKEISGGFVAYKLASALLKRQDKYLFTLAAITTISDMMPLLNENHCLVKRGLEFMNQEKYPALEMLLPKPQPYTSRVIGFTIAPKINSFGRLPELTHPNVLVKYFMKDCDPAFRREVASKADEINSKRQSMTTEQSRFVDYDSNDRCVCFASADYHEGLIGLIASRLTREHSCPSFIMSLDEDTQILKGSARSLVGFSLYDFFERHPDLFLTCGGHAMAGGFSLHNSRLNEFKELLNEELENVVFEDEEDVIDVPLDMIDLASVESLSLLEPYGMCHEEPLFYLHNVQIKSIQLLSEGKHLKMILSLPHGDIDALFFSHGHLYETLKNESFGHFIGQLSVNTFRNQKTINFMIKEITTPLY